MYNKEDNYKKSYGKKLKNYKFKRYFYDGNMI